MKDSREFDWRKYRSDFLSANHCTVDEFERAYTAFMTNMGPGKPNMKAYRQFARKYRITIVRDLNIPEDMQVVLSVSISAIKVMSETFQESIAAVEEIIKAAL